VSRPFPLHAHGQSDERRNQEVESEWKIKHWRQW
jgi:hypothetical protein